MENFSRLLEILQDREKTKDFAKQCVQNQDDDTDASFLEFQLVCVHRDLDVIFDHAESPIEKIFLCALEFSFLASGHLVRMVAPSRRALQDISQYRDGIVNAKAWRAFYEVVPLEKRVISFERLLDQVAVDEGLGSKWAANIKTDLLLGADLGFNDAFHVMPQAGFPDIQVDGRGVRADIFIFVPENPKVQLVVECDGFQYHNDKDQFLRDRKRDRAFAANGISVRRYGGAEINANPPDVSLDLLKYLVETWPKQKARKIKPDPKLIAKLARRMAKIHEADKAGLR